MRIAYADAWTAFGNHSICDSDSEDAWLNGLQIDTSGPKRQSFHPNADGQAKGYPPAFLRALGQ